MHLPLDYFTHLQLVNILLHAREISRHIRATSIMYLCIHFIFDSVIGPFRQYADRGASFIVRIFLLFFGFHWIHYRGRRAKTKDAPIVIMAPHSSFLDVFVASLYGAPTFVARHDMGNIRLFGRKLLCASMSWLHALAKGAESLWLPLVTSSLRVRTADGIVVHLKQHSC